MAPEKGTGFSVLTYDGIYGKGSRRRSYIGHQARIPLCRGAEILDIIPSYLPRLIQSLSLPPAEVRNAWQRQSGGGGKTETRTGIWMAVLSYHSKEKKPAIR